MRISLTTASQVDDPPARARRSHIAQDGDREQRRRPHWPIGLLELAGEAGGCDDIAGAPDAGAAALAMGDQDRLAEARGDRPGGGAHMDHKRAAADRGAVGPFGGEARLLCATVTAVRQSYQEPKSHSD